MGDDRLTVQQDQFGLDNGIRISYTYTADSTGTATINFMPDQHRGQRQLPCLRVLQPRGGEP